MQRRGQRIPGRRGLFSEGPTDFFSLRLPAAEAEQLRAEAARKQLSINKYLADLVTRALRRAARRKTLTVWFFVLLPLMLLAGCAHLPATPSGPWHQLNVGKWTANENDLKAIP